MRAAVKTSIGNVRKTNEDSYAFAPPYFFAVADGMGGHVAGEIASIMAIKTISRYIDQHMKDDRVLSCLQAAVEEANRLVFQAAQAHQECLGMGTTVTAAYLSDRKLYWSHVGDSRLYVIRDGVLHQLTKDHSVVGELLQNGSITAEEALVHPHRNILTRAVGTEETVTVDTGCCLIAECEKIMLCTDGLTSMLSEHEISAIIENAPDLETALERLVAASLAHGGYDNITIILADKLWE